MGLGTRTSDPRRVISLFDEVIAHVPAPDVHKYALSRNIADLGDLSACPTRPVIFTLSPLLTTTEGLADNDHACVQFHLSAVENAPPLWNFHWIEARGGQRYLADECMEKLPRNVVAELARVVRELANGDTAPFSPPDGWQGWRVRALALQAAKHVATQRATDPATNTENSP
jgi:hypothetical protein